MGNINELADLVKELEAQLAVCVRCGMCQSVCPLFEQTGREADVARGKLALLNGLMTHMFSDPDGVNERLNRCLLCGSCAANCPSGVNVLEIFIKARAILAGYKGLSWIKKIIFRYMLSNPETFNTLMGWAYKFQGLLSKNNQNYQGTSCARFISPLLKHRHFIPVAKNPFHKKLKQMQVVSNTSGVRVLLFTGCIIDKIIPQIAVSSVEALTYHNVELVIPQMQGCCGIPALASGDRLTFDSLLAYHIDLFEKEKFDYLVTACATCTSTIKKLWPTFYQGAGKRKDEKQDKAFLNKLAENTMDINQFFVDVLGVASTGLSLQKEPALQSKAVTYHDPCHLKKSLGIYEQPRLLLNAAGFKVNEMVDCDKCCGMGGSFNLLHYDLSSRIGQIKQQNIVDTHCSTVTSACPACIMQISDMLSRAGVDIKVKHPVELYAKSLKNL